jgi:hypothetical protein
MLYAASCGASLKGVWIAFSRTETGTDRMAGGALVMLQAIS